MKFIYMLSVFCCTLTVGDFASKFPDNFLLGFATASYQIEGAWNEDGKGENVWDRYAHSEPSKIRDKSNGDVACDSYHLYKEDVQMLKNIGANVYRFSLSWSRILPKGDVSFVNKPGVEYYNNLINELLRNDIEPVVTLFHWDLPQCLQDLGGWPNPVIANYFEDYARLAFQLFGDRVKWWITFNEPLEVCHGGYGGRYAAPGVNLSGTADYLCAHTILKSHARVYHMYNYDFKPVQKGQVGITLNGGWNEPLTDSKEDKEAAETSLQFQLGWFLHPLLGAGGNYPPIMREKVDSNSKAEKRSRSRLPVFDEDWKSYIRGSLDFLGINHYTSYLITPANDPYEIPSFENDMGVTMSQNSSWPDSKTVSWLKHEPTGFRKKLNWLKEYTNNFPIFITENGWADAGELNDHKRIEYYKDYLEQLLIAIFEDGCNVIGYIAWSLMDNFEWSEGYGPKFGVYHVDFQSPNRTRTPKQSVNLFKALLKTKTLPRFSYIS